MTNDFAVKYIWACAVGFISRLAGEIFLFKIVKMNLSKSRQKKKKKKNCQSCQIKQNTYYQLCQQTHFYQIKLKIAANNMSNIHISTDVLSTFMSL